MRNLWRRLASREMARLRAGGRAGLLWSLRITVAAVSSYVVAKYVVAEMLFHQTAEPLLAPLTAMLVVQVTPVSLLVSGLDRVVAVVSGVSLAVLFSLKVPLEWWSLGVLIFLAITIGQALRLRANLVEVAISGMLVLGVGSLGAGWQRVSETLVGAAVGIATNLLFPPKVASVDAGKAIDGLADAVSGLLGRAADELTDQVEHGGDVAPVARTWLGDARRITHDIPQVGAALLRAEQSRRFNVRAVGRPDVGPGLRQGLEALEHSAVAIRTMFRSVVDATTDAAWLEDEGARDVLLGLAQTFRELAASVDAFGQLVRDEADPAARMSTADVRSLREALDGLHEARARLDELLTTSSAPELLELHAAVLSAVKRLRRELDLDERIRRQFRLLPAPRTRRRSRGQGTGDQPPTGQALSPDTETQVLPVQPPPRRRGKRP
jgi:Aromatic acid exporter family member 1